MRRGPRTSVRTRPDVNALASAVSRPGVDPRVWITLAVVTELGYDPDEGPFADLQYQPNGDQETALIGSNYAGAEFGDWSSVEIGDTVLVAVPMGDPGNGPTIICRMWNAGDKPFAEMQDADDSEVPTQNRVLRVKPGKKFQLVISGDGARIELAQKDATQSFVRGDDYADAEGEFLDALDTFVQTLATATPAPPNSALTVAAVLAAANIFRPKITAFKNARNDYLSTKIKGE